MPNTRPDGTTAQDPPPDISRKSRRTDLKGEMPTFPAVLRLALVGLVVLSAALACNSVNPGEGEIPTEAPTATPTQTPSPAPPTVTVTPTPPAFTATPTAVPETATPQPSSTPTVRPVVEPVRAAPTPEGTATPAPAPTPLPIVTPPPDLHIPNVADVVERVRPAVVSLVVKMAVRDFFGNLRNSFGSGTGVIISPEGYVITNNHVVEGAVEIMVTLDDGEQVEAELVGADALSDLAVLRIPGSSHPALPLSADVPLRVGEWVVAIGNALGLPGGPTVTVGVVSALGRTIDGGGGYELYDLIQTDTVINSGNSGGPLINVYGDLIGINTVVLRGGRASGGTPVEGIGFAINMETARWVTDQLIEDGRVKWAWMGVLLADLTPEMAAEFKLPVREGAIIQSVVEDSPAHRAGILPGDIVVSMDGEKVSNVSGLLRLLRTEIRVGQEVKVEIFSGGSTRTVHMVLGDRPSR